MRIDWIDRYKGLLIILVVMGHVLGGAVHLTTNTVQTVLHDAYLVIYSFHMPAFFFLAGWMWRDRNEGIGAFALKKAKRLLVPYLVFGVWSSLVYCLMAGSVTESIQATVTTTYYDRLMDASIGTCLLSLLHGGGWPGGEGFRMNQVLWFLPCMFSTMVVWKCLRVRKFEGLKVLGCLVLAIVVPRWNAYLPWGFSKVPEYLLYVMFGQWWGKLGEGDLSWLRGRYGVVGLAVVGYVALVCWLPDPWVAHAHAGWKMVFWGVAAVGCVLSMEVAKLMKGRWLVACGAASMGIMLMHKFLVVFLELKVSLVRQMLGASLCGAIGGSMVLVAVVTVICYSLTWLARKTIPEVLGEPRKLFQ